MNLNLYRLNKIGKYLLFEINDNDFNEDDLLNKVGELISNNTGILQIKNNSLNTKKFISLAQKIKLICAQLDVIFLTTDRCDIAIVLNSDGIVLSENELDAYFARHLLGNEKIIGTHDTNDLNADFYIIKDNSEISNKEKIYFQKDINTDCPSNCAVYLRQAYRK